MEQIWHGATLLLHKSSPIFRILADTRTAEMERGCTMGLKGRQKRGFTLVELLIVIIIIGILASAMLLLMGTAEDKAEATSIISDMRSMKSVMVIFKLDKGHWPDLAVAADEAEVKKMLGGTDVGEFDLKSSGDLYAYISYNLTPRSSGVKKKAQPDGFRYGAAEGRNRRWFRRGLC